MNQDKYFIVEAGANCLSYILNYSMSSSSGDIERNDDERALMAPFEYIRSMPGKQIRLRYI